MSCHSGLIVILICIFYLSEDTEYPLFSLKLHLLCLGMAAHVWSSEDDLQESVLTFHCLGPRD